MKHFKLNAIEKRSQALSNRARDLGAKSQQLCSQSLDLRTKSKKLIETTKPHARGKQSRPNIPPQPVLPVAPDHPSLRRCVPG
jgi:hypothetical protein